AVRPQLVAEPVCGIVRAERAGVAVRVLDELGCERHQGRAIQRGELLRWWQRRRACNAERGDEERQSDEQPCPAIELRVDGTLEGPGPRSPRGGRRNSRHAGL